MNHNFARIQPIDRSLGDIIKPISWISEINSPRRDKDDVVHKAKIFLKNPMEFASEEKALEITLENYYELMDILSGVAAEAIPGCEASLWIGYQEDKEEGSTEQMEFEFVGKGDDTSV
jgi:hypothetical protein